MTKKRKGESYIGGHTVINAGSGWFGKSEESIQGPNVVEPSLADILYWEQKVQKASQRLKETEDRLATYKAHNVSADLIAKLESDRLNQEIELSDDEYTLFDCRQKLGRNLR